MCGEQANLPFVWHAKLSGVDDFEVFCRGNIDQIQAELLKHGAILFKGFGVNSAEKLQRCVAAMPGDTLNYVDGNSPRTKLGNAVYTSTEHPSELFISLHSELSYTTSWPAHIYFCCEIAPTEGGNTLIADNRAILTNLPIDIVDLFSKKGVKYIRNLHGGAGAVLGRSWQNTFETDNKSVVEEYCKVQSIDYLWKDGGGLRLIQTGGAIAKHPRTNEQVWFNQADQFHPSTNPPDVYEAIVGLFSDPFDMPQNACFGDDAPIDPDMLDVIRDVTEKHTTYFPWETGDFLVLDNMLMSHGRSPFKGDRKILVAMSK
jgi:alpha-ketoglutarate-dependent taurine dioxygenase